MIRENVLGRAICRHVIDHMFNQVDIRVGISRLSHEIDFFSPIRRGGLHEARHMRTIAEFYESVVE